MNKAELHDFIANDQPNICQAAVYYDGNPVYSDEWNGYTETDCTHIMSATKGVMALSTFFTGLSMEPKNKTGKWLRALLMIHGVFYFSCTFMPITGMFARMSSGGDGIGGRLALVAWCVYFLPIGILSFLHFHFGKR